MPEIDPAVSASVAESGIPFSVLVVAAGSGTRLGAGTPKALVRLADGRTLLEHCLQNLLDAGPGPGARLSGIAVVIPPDSTSAAEAEAICRSLADRSEVRLRTVRGGAERADSVRTGLEAVRALAGEAEAARGGAGAGGPFGRHAVLVHDAARPFVPASVIRAVLRALAEGASAVVPGLDVVDTIKAVADGVVTGTVDRTGLRAVQTPQGFDLTALQAAHRSAEGAVGGVSVEGSTEGSAEASAAGDTSAALTDDAMAMEAAGHEVHVVPGDPLAFKITTPLDLLLAEAVLTHRAASAGAPTEESRP